MIDDVLDKVATWITILVVVSFACFLFAGFRYMFATFNEPRPPKKLERQDQ